MKIAAITSGKNTPSTRFRIRQHIKLFSQKGIEVNEYYPWLDKNAGLPSIITDSIPRNIYPFMEFSWQQLKKQARISGVIKSWSHDLTWLGRELLPGRYTLERFLHKPIVFDVDDAIWQAKPHGVKTISRIAKESTFITAGNTYIAEWMKQYNQNIEIIPTAIDIVKYKAKEWTNTDREKYPFIIGWTGSAGNYVYLYNIEKELNNFLSQYNSKLLIIAESPPCFKHIASDKIKFVEWSEKTEASALLKMDVGLMPLPDTAWTRGKCAFKMLQYMACCVPVIVSPVGMNKEVLNMGPVGFGAEANEEFLMHLIHLYENPEVAFEMGNNGRKIIEQYFSTIVINEKLSMIFNKIKNIN